MQVSQQLRYGARTTIKVDVCRAYLYMVRENGELAQQRFTQSAGIRKWRDYADWDDHNHVARNNDTKRSKIYV